MLFKAFWKTRIFTETGDVPKVLVFGSKLVPSLPHEDGRNQTAIWLSKGVKIKALLTLNENYDYFLLHLVFFRVQMGNGSRVKDQDVTA